MKVFGSFQGVVDFIRPAGAGHVLGQAHVPLLDLAPRRAADPAMAADGERSVGRSRDVRS